LDAVRWVYAEIVRVLHRHERVEVVCHDPDVREDAQTRLDAHGCDRAGYRLHVVPNDRIWLRDSAPTVVVDATGRPALMNWRFNAWAKYDNYELDARMGEAVATITGHSRVVPRRPDTGATVVLEGGAIEGNGAGVLMVTEECLLSTVQERNPGLSREGYEQVFADTMGIRRTLWLGEGCVGDDTHGHIDDIARFADPSTVLLAYEDDPDDKNHARSVENLRRLQRFDGGSLRIRRLPYPRAVMMEGQRLPASYANFYVANGVVIVPTFNDAMDRVALAVIAESFPGRQVIGIHAVDLVWGLGTLHCLSQQEPAPTL
jgi:agmatine deiminase